MRGLRLTLVVAMTMVALFVGSGVASAGLAWCEIGSPPPMDTPVADGGTLAPRPDNGHPMPTPLFQNANGKFLPNPVATDGDGQYPYLLPPGMGKAAQAPGR